MAGFDVVLLGTGSPLPNADRCGAGQVIIVGEERILVDCGWGVARRLFAAGVAPPMVNTVAFTHMHSDHITDVPDFLIMRWAGGARNPLTVYGPEGTQGMIDGFLAGLERDIAFRFAHHGEKLSQEGIRCIVHEVPATAEPRLAAEIAGISIESFEVDHFPVVPALGFRLTGHGATVVISGDTKRCDNLVRASVGADILICEAMNADLFSVMVQRIQAAGNQGTAAVMADVPDYHMTTIEAAEMARDAGVKKLVLSHLIPPVPNEGPLADAFSAGMANVFAGEIVVGKDLMRLHAGGA
ncbi:MAG TPA: MBL fold metallo-hydrolase [Dehalococcoidia bacterium]|nr:MBL fold metallo-hydrolase [Dehalococcoidia bacterium]